jgi:hypothetical protein
MKISVITILLISLFTNISCAQKNKSNTMKSINEFPAEKRIEKTEETKLEANKQKQGQIRQE